MSSRPPDRREVGQQVEQDPIASPALIVMKAADASKDKTTTPNQLWRTGFTYLGVI